MFVRRHTVGANGQTGPGWRDDPSEPHPCPLGPGPEPLVLVAAPADQVGVYPPQGAAESRPIEVAVVVDPALDVRIEHPCQILQGLVASSVECPPTNRLPYCLQRLWTSRGQERDTELTPAPDSRPRTKLVSEKVERLDRIISLTVSIPAVDELRLLRMQNQPAGPETALQGAPQFPSLLGTSTMADEVVRISFEWDAWKVPHHPHVEGVVQEQIGEARAYHPTLRSSRRTRYDAAILHLYRSLQPAARCRGAPKGNPYVYGPLSGAVPNRCCRSSSERRRLAPSRTASSAGGSPGLHQSPIGPAGSHRSPHGRSLPGWAPGSA